MARIFSDRLAAFATSRKFRRRSTWRWIPVLPLTMLFLATIYNNTLAPPRASAPKISSQDIPAARDNASDTHQADSTPRLAAPINHAPMRSSMAIKSATSELHPNETDPSGAR